MNDDRQRTHYSIVDGRIRTPVPTGLREGEKKNFKAKATNKIKLVDTYNYYKREYESRSDVCN